MAWSDTYTINEQTDTGGNPNGYVVTQETGGTAWLFWGTWLYASTTVERREWWGLSKAAADALFADAGIAESPLGTGYGKRTKTFKGRGGEHGVTVTYRTQDTWTPVSPSDTSV